MEKTKLLNLAIELAKQSEDYTKSRIEQIIESENLYDNYVENPLPGLYNAPVPVMGGFVDTLLSRISGKTVINFNKQDNSDAIKAKKITAMWLKDSSPSRGKWHEKDILAKKLAIFSGRAIYKIWSESDPQYKNHLEVIHYKDFLCEPKGGYYLEDHLYCGQKNIFKTKSEIKQGIKDGIYLAEAKDIFDGEDNKTYSDDYNQMNNVRENKALASNNPVKTGVGVANLYEMYITTDEGRYYILFSKDKKIVVRIGKLKDILGNDLYPYVSWATHPELSEFWSKAAADDIKAIAYSINTIFNQALNNLQKRNFPQRAYDVNMFNDPTKLYYSPDGVVPVNSYGNNIANGVYEFQTPDNTQITMNLINFMDSLGGLKTGVTAGVQGASREKAVGIYYGNMEQIANRFGPMSTYYTTAWVDLGTRYLIGLQENLTEKEMVKMIGVDGITWDTLRQQDLKTKEDLEINITATNQESELKEAEIKTKTQALALITNNPAYAAKLSPDWVITETLKMGGYDDDQIMLALDVNNTASEDQLNKAAEVIEDVLEGKKPKMNFTADTGFIQKIIDYAVNTVNLDAKKMQILYEYAMAHMDIVSKNTVRKAMSKSKTPVQNGLSTNNVPGLTTLNIPNPTPNNVQQRSQELVNQNKI